MRAHAVGSPGRGTAQREPGHGRPVVPRNKTDEELRLVKILGRTFLTYAQRIWEA